MLVKLGEAVNITASDIQTVESVFSDPDILEKFKKFAADLKTISPLANDFLYFTAIMMHSAEASILDKDGNIKKDASGKDLEVKWEPTGDNSIKWVCSDANIRPLKNSNGDIFPEQELLKAYKLWIGKPLCVDHKSSSVDAVRGLILDTYYDRKYKRVIALCALDRKNYPDLARKIATGYATSVSMGTGVGRAICTEHGCHRVARVESDFCDHMRKKSGYGEINMELSPMELSIVVNGADPDAKVKHIIAKDLSQAADNLHEYMESKISYGKVNNEELAAIQKDLNGLSEIVAKLVSDKLEASMDANNVEYGTTQSTKEMVEPAIDTAQPPVSPNNYLVDWSAEMENLTVKLSTLQQDLGKLIKLNKESNMTNEKKAYYQGTVEPKPGSVQYPNEVDYKKIRDTEDKQMVGQSPFPGVGPVDGMHPGPASAGESDEARKKRLQRLADVKDRSVRRLAALDNVKKAYMQGTEPPHKYPEMKVDNKGYQEIRDKEDKQMVGQKPFPDVGPIDGLHPSPTSADQKDELKRKEMLARAGLKGKFVKTVNPDGKIDYAKSRWDIYAGKNLILTATVHDITGGNASDVLYNSIATEAFGKDIINKIKSEGFDAAKSTLIKSAVPLPPAATMAAPMGGAADEAPQGNDMPSEPEGGGSPVDHVKDLIDQVKDSAQETARQADDLSEALSVMEGESTDLKDVKPADEASFADDGKEKVESVASLQSMRKTVNSMLQESMKEAIAELRGRTEELSLASDIYKNKFAGFTADQKKYVDSLASDAVADAKRAVANSYKLMSAFVKYAHGTQGLLKRAADEMPSSTKPAAEKKGHSMEGYDMPMSGQHQDVKPGEVAPKDSKLDKGAADAPVPMDTSLIGGNLMTNEERGKMLQHGGPAHATTNPPVHPGVIPEATMHAPHPAHGQPKQTFVGDDSLPANDMKVELPGGTKVGVDSGTDLKDLPAGSKPATTAAPEFDLTTKAGRAEYRSKLAQKGIEWNDMLNTAHPKGGHTPSGMGSPQGNLAHVETRSEIHDAVLNLAELPPKVRKQAEQIQKLVSEGTLSPSEVDGLVAHGAHGVDADAVKYWKQFWAEAKDAESKEFASKLVSDVSQKKQAEADQAREVKIKRAYDLAYEMRDRGIIDGSQIKTQVDEILQWNDAAFETSKRVIAKSAMRKTAMPQVGLLHSGDVILPGAEPATQEQTNLNDLFAGMFAGRKF